MMIALLLLLLIINIIQGVLCFDPFQHTICDRVITVKG